MVYLIGLIVSELLRLPAPVLGALAAVVVAGLIYRKGWNDAVQADYQEDLAKAEGRRRARWR